MQLRQLTQARQSSVPYTTGMALAKAGVELGDNGSVIPRATRKP
jgi:hypothetical protein